MNNEEKILSMLETLVQGQAETSQRLDRIEERLDRIEERLDRVEERLDRVEERLDRVEERLDRVEERLDTLESEVKEVKAIAIRMEISHGDKLKALSDAYLLNYDLNRETNPKINAVEIDLEKLFFEIQYLKAEMRELKDFREIYILDKLKA